MKVLRKPINWSIFIVLASFAFACTQYEPKQDQAQVSSEERSRLEAFEAAKKLTETRLTRFDSLDFEVFSKQKWEDLQVSHDENITVYWPDGHQTQGLARHLEDLKAMFVYAPDTRVANHPIKFGSGDWTCVTGTFEGTFTKPMPIGDGKTIPPTGKRFSLPMCTVGYWKNGKMIEEYLFWDNQAFMKQIGLAK